LISAGKSKKKAVERKNRTKSAASTANAASSTKLISKSQTEKKVEKGKRKCAS